MAIHLTLRTDPSGRLSVMLDGEPLAGPTPLTDLPGLPALQAAPYDEGRALTRTLGGDALLARLADGPDRLLLLDADEATAAVPWEFAALPGRQLLACHYGLLRLVDELRAVLRALEASGLDLFARRIFPTPDGPRCTLVPKKQAAALSDGGRRYLFVV